MKRALRTLNKNGVALITVMLIFLILVVLLGGVMFWSVSNNSQTAFGSQHTAAYYSAESAINLQIVRFEDKFAQAKSESWSLGKLREEIQLLVVEINTSHDIVGFDDYMGKPNFSDIQIIGPESKSGYIDTDFYKIISTGNIGDVSRTLSTEIGFTYVYSPGEINVLGGAVITKGAIAVHQNMRIKGPIASNLSSTLYSSNPTINTLNGSNLNNHCGVNLLPTDTFIDKISVPNLVQNRSKINNGSSGSCYDISSELENTIEFEPIKIPDYILYEGSNAVPVSVVNGVLDLRNSGMEYGGKKFEISSFPTGNLRIKLDGGDDGENFYLRVHNSFSSLNGTIEIEGKGQLIVLSDIENNISLNAKIHTPDPDNLSSYIFAKNNTRFNLILREVNPSNRYSISATGFNGSLLSNADINITGWNNVEFYGYMVINTGFRQSTIVGKTMNIQANSSLGRPDNPIWIYAPNAHVYFNSGVILHGSVMSESIHVQAANPRILYAQMSAGEYPFQEWTPLPYTENADGAQADLKYIRLPIIEE